MCKIRLANHKGDEVIAEYAPTDERSVCIAQAKLTAFLEDCVRQYGKQPPVWARRLGASEFEPFEGNLAAVDEVLLQFPLVGG